MACHESWRFNQANACAAMAVPLGIVDERPSGVAVLAGRSSEWELRRGEGVLGFVVMVGSLA